MTYSPTLDSAGRRRSPATLPGFHAGRAPRNKGRLYPADPPTIEEIVCVMRDVSDDPHGWRLRAMIVMLWRGGLRVQEALALSEHDLDPRRGSVLVRRGKGGRRREVGMDAWGWENLRPWLEERVELPAGPLFCVINGPTRGRPWSAAAVRTEFRRHAVQAGVRRRFAPHQLRHAHAVELAREGVSVNVIQRPARARQPRHHEHLPAGDRHRGDHLDGARAPSTNDVGDGRSPALKNPDAQSASADRGARASGTDRRFAPPSGRRTTLIGELSTRPEVVQLRRLAGYVGGACFPREAGKLSTGLAMRALPGKASVLIADPLTRHGSA
jgi:Phage integrase family